MDLEVQRRNLRRRHCLPFFCCSPLLIGEEGHCSHDGVRPAEILGVICFTGRARGNSVVDIYEWVDSAYRESEKDRYGFGFA